MFSRQSRWSTWKCNVNFPWPGLMVHQKVLWTKSPRPWVSSCPWGQNEVLSSPAVFNFLFVFFVPSKCFGCFHFCLFFIHFARSILVGHIGKVFLCRTRAIVLEWLGLYDIQWILEHIYTNGDCEMMKPGFDRRDEKGTNVGQMHPSAARREKLYGTRWRLSLPPHRLRAQPSRHWKHMEAHCKHPVKS